MRKTNYLFQLSMLIMTVFAPCLIEASGADNNYPNKEHRPACKLDKARAGVSFSSGCSSMAQASAGVPVKTFAPGFQVVQSDIVGNSVHLKLSNGYIKNIIAYGLSIGSTKVETDLLDSDTAGAIPPGTTYDAYYPIEPHIRTEGVTILAVVFEGGVTDGDAQFAKDILEKHAGRKKQLGHILDLFRTALLSTDIDTPAALDRLISLLSALPISDQSQSFNTYNHGLLEAQLLILNKLFEHRHLIHIGKNVAIRDELIAIKNYLEKIGVRP